MYLKKHIGCSFQSYYFGHLRNFTRCVVLTWLNFLVQLYIPKYYLISALICDLMLVLALFKRSPLMFMPGIIIQMMIIIILVIDSIVLYIGWWTQLNMVYNGLIPGMIGCYFLSTWFLTYNYFKLIWSEKQRISIRFDNNV